MSRLINAARGEVGLSINGEVRTLCLTLGALARLEQGLGVRGLTGLEARLRQLSAQDLALVIAALICDDGKALSVNDVTAAQLSPIEAAQAIAACFEAAAGDP